MKDGRVTLEPRIMASFTDGKLCPPDGSYQIQFLLESKLAGNSYRHAKIEIASDIPSEDRYDIRTIEGEDHDDWLSTFTTRPVILDS